MEQMDAGVVFGPLADFMSDPTIEEIWINSPERIFVAKAGKSQLTNLVFTADQVRALVERSLIWSGRRLDISQPFVDARLPDGSRLHVVIPEITAEHWAINIRKHLMRHKTLADLLKLNVMNSEMKNELSQSVKNGKNILVSGGTQAGKTTLLNALVNEIAPTQRVITIEEVFELQPRIPDLIQMQTRAANLQGDGAISLRKLIKEALRMRPARIVVGEVREAEALDLLLALNSGLPGMGTLHANSCRDAITKLQTLPLLAGENISYEFIAPVVASAIDLVIQVSLDSAGIRRIVEIARVTGRCERNIVEVENLWRWDGNHYLRGVGSAL
jgi:pilus assembly protein CpaF